MSLCVDWNECQMRVNAQREFLLKDSVDAVMSLKVRDLCKIWRFEFIGEAGIEAVGLARQWFQLVAKEIFDSNIGRWESSEMNQMMMVINLASSKSDRLLDFLGNTACIGLTLFCLVQLIRI